MLPFKPEEESIPWLTKEEIQEIQMTATMRAANKAVADEDFTADPASASSARINRSSLITSKLTWYDGL